MGRFVLVKVNKAHCQSTAQPQARARRVGGEDPWRGQASAQACCDAYNAKDSSVKASDRKALARKQSLLRKSGVLCGRYRPQGGASVGSQEAAEPPRCAAAKKRAAEPLRSSVLAFALDAVRRYCAPGQ